MTIYVDALENWGWRLRGRLVPSCHMFTDAADLEELHVFAERIGMRRSWFQLHRVAPHYDLTSSRRTAAVQLGAVEVGRREASEIWRARREAVAPVD
ncbi:DUF4031 domain-containing protein [Burkholderia multivorans]|nr:DUF4031 domain-containing protein [Burkholderia multivorans]